MPKKILPLDDFMNNLNSQKSAAGNAALGASGKDDVLALDDFMSRLEAQQKKAKAQLKTAQILPIDEFMSTLQPNAPKRAQVSESQARSEVQNQQNKVKSLKADLMNVTDETLPGVVQRANVLGRENDRVSALLDDPLLRLYGVDMQRTTVDLEKADAILGRSRTVDNQYLGEVPDAATVRKNATESALKDVRNYSQFADLYQGQKEAGDKDNLKMIVNWGRQNSDDVTTTTRAAAAAASDTELQSMLKSARTEGERSIIQAEIERRKPAVKQKKQEAAQGIFDLLTPEQNYSLWESAARTMSQPSVNDAIDVLEEERAQIDERLQDVTLSEGERKQLEQRRLDILNGQRNYAGETLGPESPEVAAYREMQATGGDLSYTQRYTEDNKKAAEAWRKAQGGAYTGDDPEVLAYQNALNGTYDEWERLFDEAYNGVSAEDGHVLSEQELAEKRQKLEELKTQAEAQETMARENERAARENVTSVNEALYGKSSVGRLVGSSVWKGFAGFANKFYQAVDLVLGKPITAVGQLFDKNYQSTLTKLANAYRQGVYNPAVEESNMATNALGGGKGWEIASETISGTVENIPNVIMAMLSGGASAAAGLAGTQAAAVTAMNEVGTSAAMRVAGNLLSDYNYWTSFMQEIGGDYEEAVNAMGENASPITASVYAMVTCFINAGIEIGGEGTSGIQGIGKEKDSGILGDVIQAVTGRDMPLLESILDSASDEAMEELKQGIVSGLAMKAIVDHDLQWISTDGSDAVFNAQQTGESMLVGGLTGALMAGTSEPIANITQQRAQDVEIGRTVLENEWGAELGAAAESAGMTDDATSALREGTLDANKKGNQRKVGKAYREIYGDVALDTETDRKTREEAAAMLTYNKGKIATGDTQGAIDTGKKLAGTAKISGDGKLHTPLKETTNAQEMREKGQEIFGALKPGESVEQAEESEELVGVEVKDGKPYVKVRPEKGAETQLVPFEDVEFPDQETAEKAAISIMVGSEEVANAVYNSRSPESNTPFADYARQFINVFDAARKGISMGAIRLAGLNKGLADVEVNAAYQLGKVKQFVSSTMEEARQKTQNAISAMLRGKVSDGDVNGVAEAILKQETGEELTPDETALLEKYEQNKDVQGVIESVQDEDINDAPAIGTNEAYQYGYSGRSLEELESTLKDQGTELTDEIRAEYERGAANLAQEETERIKTVKQLNQGQDGTRKGVLRGISVDEAARFGVGQVTSAFTKQTRSAVTALRGLAEDTGVNMVLFESPIKEGTHQGANGWYDRDTRTVYLDVFSGEGNEQALIRTAAHELTHFIKDWSPAQYKRLREFLLSYYYSTDNNTVKRLIQEQMDKDKTLRTESEAMEEVIADASEMMISGDQDAITALAEQHPTLFARVRKWVDTWAKAVVRAWHGITGTSNEASRLLKKSAEHFTEAQRIWWEALSDASVNYRGEVKLAEIELTRTERLAQAKEKAAQLKQQYEKRRAEAVDRATKAETVEEAQEAMADVEAADAQKKAADAQAKEETKKINQEAEEERKEAEKTTKAGQRIEKQLNKLPEDARAYVLKFAEENGIALDGSQQTGKALAKEAVHYYNQGKAGIDFNANTDAGKGVWAEFARQMNAHGKQTNAQTVLETVAEQETEEKTREQIAEEVVRNGFDDERLLNLDAINSMPQEDLELLAGISEGTADTSTEETTDTTEGPTEIAPTAEETTPEETQAVEAHAETVEKMADVLKGMPKRARDLVMKWGANEYVNVNMEDGSAAGVAFAKFAAKWYNAGKEGTPVTRVPFMEADAEYPPFLQDTFYKQGAADAQAAEKRKKAKEAKKNEKLADKGTEESAGQPGTGTGRVLEEVPAEVLQNEGGGRDTVSEPAVSEQRDGGNDAEPDGAGAVRERGEGVRERDDVRPAAGEVTEEEATPEEQLAETVEETETLLEAETPRGTNYRIGESLDLPNGEKARYKANVDAIRLLKQLEAEGRYATQEEQDILSKYVGWGGLAQAFDENNPKWAKEYAELAEILTKEEYDAARASTVNAHYTSIEVIRAMYDGLRQLGFEGGRMLEPSGGIGHFIGAMPADMQQKVRSWTMVELDSITGRIAEKLYPNADVRVEGFENAKIGNNVMDVAIGNVPFGNFPIVDASYPRTVTSAIHNYFFAKAIDKVRPGGLLMFITSRYTMDAQSNSVREYMMERADLLGAVRLPNTAFKGNAGTEVVTDILVFKKREAGTPYKGEDMRYVTWQPIGNSSAYINKYFVDHPEMVLGETALTGTMYRGQELTVNPKPGDLGDQIREAMGKIEGRMDYSQSAPSVEELQKRAEKARKNTKENGFEIKEGKLFQNVGGELQAVDMKEADVAKVRDMLAIRDAARELQELQKQGATEEAIKAQRKQLNALYDTFVSKNGVLHDRKNAKLIESDPDHFFIMALEDYDKKAKTATKAAIFDRNTIAKVVTVNHAETAQDAISVVLNEKGYIDLARAAELLGVSEEKAQAAMIDSGLAFLKPDGTLDTRENYLSGNVRAKLREAEALATVDERYQRNVDELRKVIPEDIGRESIYVKPGATWIPESVYEQFICEMLRTWNGYRRNVTVKYIPSSGDYTLELSTQAKRDYRNTQEWGTPDKTFAEILDALMNNKQISVYRKMPDGKSILDDAASQAAREKAEKIQQRFQEWLWQDETRAKQLETLYNDKYNAIVTPDYDGSGLTIAGANADKQLRPHQKNVVHRIVQGGGNTLIAHCVGAGKTAEMAGAAMKLRQLGIVQKPVFVVPKALVGQWGREFLDFFPAAKILVLSENDFNAKNRKEFANRIATGDYDAVIMSREQYSHIPMTPEYEKKFYADTIQQIADAIEEEKRQSGKQGLSVKNMEKTRKRLEAKLKKLETKARDADNIYFEDMGIDSIFVDEAHEYKNLMFTSNMNNVSGLGNKEGSQRAFDMYMKTRYLRQLNGGRGIVFATATPVMNSMSEMYIMQKYLQEDTLNQLGIQSFDAWANLFGEVMTVVEPTPSGKGFRMKQAFARFKNLPELQRLFRSFADVKTKVEGLKIPKMKGGKRITIECEPGQFQLDYIDQLAERANRLKSGHVDPKVDNMLKITSEGRKLSYTQRMIDPSLPYEDGSKLVRCVEEVEKIWKESKANKGTQLIFCDMATPKGSSTVDTDAQTDTAEDAENVDFYGDIKRMLIARGVPANEIAFIHDADTNEKKNKLFEDVNEGRVRVLIGSTGKMGVGMNAQKRIVALHHLDAPWRPGDIEQREGRALRQGNINEEVGIYVYVTKKTFDTRMWDNLYRKSSFINQIMNGTNTAREVEGDGDFALSAAEIKAIATGDPMIVEQFEVDNKIKQLENLEREYNREKKLARDTIRSNGTYIEAYKQRIPLAEQDQKMAAAALDKDFRMKVEGKVYDTRAKAAGPLLEAINKRQGNLDGKKIAEFGGFDILVNGRGDITIKGAGQYSVNANLDSDTGNMSRVMNKIGNIQENLDNMRAAIAKMEEENKSLQAKLEAPFERAAELEQMRARAEEIANILNPVEDQAGVQNMEEGEEDIQEEKKIKYSMRPDVPLSAEDYEENQREVVKMQPVKELQGNEFEMGTGTLEGDVLDYYQKNDISIQKVLDVNRKYSERNPDVLSDRQLLARAFEGIAKTDYERKSLERYKGMVAQLDTDNETLRQMQKQIHEKTFVKGMVDRAGAAALREQANALEKKIAETDKTLLRMERSAALKNVLEVEKREAERKVKEKIKGQLARYNEGVEKREYEARIKKTTERLAKWIVQPDKTNHVPKALRSSVARFLLSIQQGTRTEFSGEGGARRERNFLQNMRELQGIVQDITSYQLMGADERVEADFGMYIDLPDGFAEQMADLVRSVENTMEKAGKAFSVDYMNSEQLKTLYQVLSTISKSITQANDLLALNSFQHVSEAAQNSVKFIRSQGRVANGSPNGLHNFLSWDNLQPIRAFARFGEGGEAIFKALQKGQAQMAYNVQRVVALSDAAYTSEEAKTWTKEIKTFTIGGKQISMPVADVMSLYCLMKRQQAVGHLLGEGFRVADFKEKGKMIAGTGVTITQEEAQQVMDSLTARQRAVADRLQEIMSTVGSDWGNYVSMKRFGYEMFTEKNYFPIEVDSDRLTAKTDESKGNELYRLLNISSVKPITRGARNRIMIKNIFEVYASHMSDMAQYNAMGLPVLDAVKWINYRSSVENTDGGILTDGVRDAAREMYGRKAPQYIVNLLKDVNGTQATGDIGETISRKMLMRYNRQAVAANLSVAAKQPMSIIRAGMELGGTDIILGIMGNKGLYKQNVEEMLRYSGIAVWKDLGFYDVNVSRPVKQMIMHNESALDNLIEKTTWFAEKADKITWSAMWGASKRFVEHSGQKYNSTEEFMQAVADKFEDVIYKTQVVDSILTRSQFMRGMSFTSKMFTSFMSEPTTTYNMLLDTAHKFFNDIRKGDSWGRSFIKHGGDIARTTAVYMTSAAVMTVLEALIGAWRDDDDYETFMEKFQAGLLDSAVDEFMPLTLLPVVQDVYDYAKKLLAIYAPDIGISGYGSSNVVYSALEDVTDLAEIVKKFEEGKTRYTAYGIAYKAAKVLSEAAGVPVAPAMREVMALWNNIAPVISPNLRVETYESTVAMGASALYKAMTSGDAEREKKVRAQLSANGVEEKKLNSALKTVIKEELASGNITEQQTEKYLVKIAAMDKDDAYFQTQTWTDDDGTYSRYDNLKTAINSGNGIDAAIKELTGHGYTEKQVQTKVRSYVTEAATESRMAATKAASLLVKYGGMNENEAWIRTQEYQYEKLTGKATTSDIAMIIYAIDKNSNPKEAIDGLVKHGKEKSGIASAITSHYKEEYLGLVTGGKISQAATLKGRLISTFEYLGYDGKKKVEAWEKQKQK